MTALIFVAGLIWGSLNLAAAAELTGLLYCYDTTFWPKGSLE
jgi:hypothetical protein